MDLKQGLSLQRMIMRWKRTREEGIRKSLCVVPLSLGYRGWLSCFRITLLSTKCFSDSRSVHIDSSALVRLSLMVRAMMLRRIQ